MLSRWVVSSEGERFLDTEEVTGSIPVPPTIDYSGRFLLPMQETAFCCPHLCHPLSKSDVSGSGDNALLGINKKH